MQHNNMVIMPSNRYEVSDGVFNKHNIHSAGVGKRVHCLTSPSHLLATRTSRHHMCAVIITHYIMAASPNLPVSYHSGGTHNFIVPYLHHGERLCGQGVLP